MNKTQIKQLADNWGFLLARGIFGILFGILAFAWPGLTLFTLVIVWGSYVAMYGIFSLIAAFKGKSSTPRWWLIFVGLISLAAAFTCFAWPMPTTVVLVMIMAGWCIALGIFEIIGAISVRKEIEGEWWLILSGVLSVLVGIFLFARPVAGTLSLVWVIGSFSIVMGIFSMGFAFRLRKTHKMFEKIEGSRIEKQG